MDWNERIRGLACRWLLQTESGDKFPSDCLFLFGNPDLFRPSVIEGVLKNITRKGAFYTGTYKNREICYVTPKLGAPAVSIYLEVISRTSISRIIAVGFAGGLRQGQNVGDYFLPTHASGLDGTTKAYFSHHSSNSPDITIQNQIQSQLDKLNFPYHTGSIVSVDTLTVETTAMINGFISEGYGAVDMETGFFVALCKHLHLKCGAAHVITDNAFTHAIDPGGKVRNSFHHLVRCALDTLLQI